MYEAYYQLREKPFSLLPDPEFLYLGKAHSMALCMLQYGLTDQAGFTVITGEVGCGKTTLIRHLLNVLDPNLTVGLISDTHNFQGELLKRVLYALGQDYKSPDGRTDLFDRFTRFVVQEYSLGRRVVIIVDEAQNMDSESLEELRTLSNVNADKDQLLQVVLVGQPELRDTLRQPGLRQFAQRVAVDYHLEPLGEFETTSYIRHRLKAVGGDPGIFPDNVCQIIHVATGGTPRLINVICELALVYGYGMEHPRIDAAVIERVLHDKTQGGLFAHSFSAPRVAPKVVEPPRHVELSNTGQNGSAPLDRALVQSHPLPVAYIHEGAHVLVNTPYAELLGFHSTEPLLGIPLLDLVIPETKESLRSLLQRYDDEPNLSRRTDTFDVRIGNRTASLEFSFDSAEVDGVRCARVLAKESPRPRNTGRESLHEGVQFPSPTITV